MERRATNPRTHLAVITVAVSLAVLVSVLAGAAVAQAVVPSEGIIVSSPTSVPTANSTGTPDPVPTETVIGTPAAAPSARCCAAMTYDAATSSVLLFGGAGLLGNFGDTWVWNGSAWNQLSPAVTPSPLYNAALAYDAANGTAILFGGQDVNSQFVNTTWIWDGSTWTQANPGSSPAARGSANLVFDAAHGTVLLFGGCCAAGGQPFDDTWSWNGSSWTQKNPDTSPPNSGSASVAYDAARQQVVLFSSCCGESGTWTWNGATWTRESTTTGPNVGGAIAFDAAQSVVELVQNDGTNWAWNGSGWSQQSAVTAPGARSQAALAYDAANQTLLLFGGSGNGFPLNDTWAFDGSLWVQDTPLTDPLPVLDLTAGLSPG